MTSTAVASKCFHSLPMMNKFTPDSKIYKDFVDQLCEWSNNGNIPETCSLDLKYAFELQSQRLKEKNVSVKYTYQIADTDDSAYATGWTDKEYSNVVNYHRFLKVRDFLVNGKRKFREKQREILYAVITRLNNPQSAKTYCCPNCGAIHTVKDLLENGCPNCKTRFIMNDLFPKITNYYSVKDYSNQGNSIKKSIAKFMISGAVLGVSLSAVHTMLTNPTAFESIATYTGFIGSAVVGLISGYVLWAFSVLGSVFKDAFKALPKLSVQLDAKRKLPEFMLRFDPNFSYEYFIGKIIALTRIMIFSSDYSNLAIYEGKPITNTNTDIIDVQFNSAVKLNHASVQGSYCTIDVTVYTTNIHCIDNLIKKKNERFRIVLCKNIMNSTDYNFSAKKVQCKGCGGSFDATRVQHCPYCNKDYRLGEDDWVVLNFHKA